MTPKRLILITSIVLAMIGGYLVWYFQPEQVVKRKLQQLFESVEMDPDDGPISRNFQTKAFTKLIAGEVHFDTPLPHLSKTYSSSELKSGHQHHCMRTRQTEIQYNDINIVELDTNQAVLTLAMEIHVTSKDLSPNKQSFKVYGTFTLEPLEDGWRLTRVEMIPQP